LKFKVGKNVNSAISAQGHRLTVQLEQLAIASAFQSVHNFLKFTSRDLHKKFVAPIRARDVQIIPNEHVRVKDL
jgi:hypothetical protein